MTHSAEKDRPACTCRPARIDGYLIHRQDCARSAKKPAGVETNALVERIVTAVRDVLLDRTYDQHAATRDLWEETLDHIRLAVTRVIPPVRGDS